MDSNLDKYKNDLKKLIVAGGQLFNAMQMNCYPKEFLEDCKKRLGDKAEDFMKKLPNFKEEYQSWYSEALVLIKQLLPDRLSDFIRLYEKSKSRKGIDASNYVIEDYLQGLHVTLGGNVKVDKTSAIPQFQQQLSIVKSIKNRFESSLFDIKQLVQSDLFDSELESAKELAKNKFIRAAGAVAGVVLEKHLHQVVENHNVINVKKNPTINDYNELLKNNNIIDTPQWRFIQHLADIRNVCDHGKTKEPSLQEVNDLITGVEKISKTVF